MGGGKGAERGGARSGGSEKRPVEKVGKVGKEFGKRMVKELGRMWGSRFRQGWGR